MRTPGTPKELERQRLRAIALLEAGHRPGEVARKLSVSPAAVSQWKKLYQQTGLEALKATPHPGPKPKLAPSQRRKLQRLLQKGPRAHGYPTDLWTLKRIAEVIRKHFAVRYDPSGVWHLLKSMAWPAPKPDRQSRQRSANAVVGRRQQQRRGI